MPEVELPNPAELEEIKNKAFTRWVALTTAVYAVMLSIAALVVALPSLYGGP